MGCVGITQEKGIGGKIEAMCVGALRDDLQLNIACVGEGFQIHSRLTLTHTAMHSWGQCAWREEQEGSPLIPLLLVEDSKQQEKFPGPRVRS
jgi:hypothetical protein